MAAAANGLNRFYYFLGAVAVVGVVALVYMAKRNPVSIPANPIIAIGDTSGFHGYYLGSDSAPLTVTEYADFECPACQLWYAVQFPTIEERLIQTGKVRWRYRDFPLDGPHPHTRLVAHAAACADEQGKYWPMNQRIYAWEPRWPEMTLSGAGSTFRDYARDLGLDLAKYDACMQSARFAGRIQASQGEGIQVGVQSTPTFLINGQLYAGDSKVHYDMLKALLDSLQGKPAK